jgi:hypothetical protein
MTIIIIIIWMVVVPWEDIIIQEEDNFVIQKPAFWDRHRRRFSVVGHRMGE